MASVRKILFMRDERAVAAIEFALVLPLLLLLFIGGFELWRYVNTVQRIEGAAFQMSNILSQTVEPNQNMTQSQLEETFNAILGENTAKESGFVVSIIGRPQGGVIPDGRNVPDPAVLYQRSKGMTSERFGGEGSPVPENVNGIDLTDRDIIVVTEISYTHKNLLGPALQRIGLLASNNETTTSGGDGQEIYRDAYIRYRKNSNLPSVTSVVTALPAPPLSCGNYRKIYSEESNSNRAYEDEAQKYYFLRDFGYDKLSGVQTVNGKTYNLVADEPNPCLCYGQGAVQVRGDRIDIQFRKQLSTCNPAVARNFSCPTWSKNAQDAADDADKTKDFTKVEANKVYNPLYEKVHSKNQQLVDSGFDQDTEYLPAITLKCEPETTPLEKECNGYITEQDLYVEATDPLNFVKCPQNKPVFFGGGTSDPKDPPKGNGGGA